MRSSYKPRETFTAAAAVDWYLARRYQSPRGGWRVGATFIDPTLLKPTFADVDGHNDRLSLALPSAVRLVLIDPSESGHHGAEASSR